MTRGNPALLCRTGPTLPAGQPRTLIVLGAARSGTTMVARMLYDLGIFMGEALSGTYQDRAMDEISRALFHRQIDIAHPAIERVLRQRDRQFAVWGWKFPTHVFEALYARTRNPHLIVTFRDPLAIATREATSHGYNIAPCLERALAQTADFGSFVLATALPCLSISYERGLARRAELVEALVDFAGITAPPSARQDAARRARPGSARYLAASRAFAIEGTIERVDTRIGGWLRYPHEGNRRVSFTVLVDNVPIGDAVADRYRADLQREFSNDGCCAFEIATPRHLMDGMPHKVSIAIPGETDYLIDNNDADWTIQFAAGSARG